MKARDSAPVGKARPSSDLVEGIARAIYEQRPVLSSGPAMSWSTLVALKDNDQCIAVLRRHREGAQAALEYISSLGMVVVPREPTEEMLKAGEIPTRPISLGNGMTTTGLGLGAHPSILWPRMIEAAPKHTALSPRDDTKAPDNDPLTVLRDIRRWMLNLPIPTIGATYRVRLMDAVIAKLEKAATVPDMGIPMSASVGEAPNNTPKVRG